MLFDHKFLDEINAAGNDLLYKDRDVLKTRVPKALRRPLSNILAAAGIAFQENINKCTREDGSTRLHCKQCSKTLKISGEERIRWDNEACECFDDVIELLNALTGAEYPHRFSPPSAREDQA